ncbi:MULTISPECIES: ABC transporter permease [Flavobacteriaceae]|uniref:ABC transporter permease n=1 Tax=Flavobacteriaceae TaxID=49546 RepID=UPI001491B0F3|nr:MULTISPECIES: ABC transporter permease [Allomuricauda]MDC6366934.1 ABC transporter permease [Muricauda sp. AC10]
MIRNYLKTAWRNLKRNKGYSAINIGGLALGMAVVIMIGLWVLDEFTFNTYHKNHDRIAQIYNRGENLDTGEIGTFNSTLYTMGSVIKENYKDYFEHVLRATWTGDYVLTDSGENHTRTGQFIESGALDMLSLNMLQGSRASLEELNAIVLSQSTALAIFGEENPIGKPIKINNEMDAVVKGVYEDLPQNNSFGFVKFFANWKLVEANEPERFERIKTVWDDWSFQLYVQLKPGIDFATADAALRNLYTQYGPSQELEVFGRRNLHPFAYPMDKWRLYSEFDAQGNPTKGRITFVWLFIAIGIFVLFLACINFMNLSTARSEKRSKEVGIRKTVGSKKKQLVIQFLTESLLISGIALLLALLLVLLSLPWFNELAGKEMNIPWGNPVFWASLLSFTVLTGILAGSYPALYLSSFSPVKVLKGTFKAGPYSAIPRKVLVVFQFAVSIMLAVGTVIVFNQIEFTKDRPLGYDQDNLISIQMNNPVYDGKYDLLRNELKKTGVVEDMAQSSSPLIGVYSNGGGGLSWQGKNPEFRPDFGILRVTHDYGKTVGWQFLEGRDFSRDHASDSLAIIINETAVKYMGLENPVGTFISFGGPQRAKIIGVTKDMVMQSPYEPVKQALFFIDYENVGYINIKIRPDASAGNAISKIEDVFDKVVPSASFDYKFIDQEFDRKFQSEQRLGNLAGVFTLLAILISCLGLFGLASFVAEQRTKEIGVRKVLGASVLNLWKMLSKDFVLLVLISGFVAIPIVYHFMSRWLQNYEYRMEIPWWVFALAVIGALLVTLLTVSYQSIWAASVNPVKSLRTE